jgi:hypothetical protein
MKCLMVNWCIVREKAAHPIQTKKKAKKSCAIVVDRQNTETDD